MGCKNDTSYYWGEISFMNIYVTEIYSLMTNNYKQNVIIINV